MRRTNAPIRLQLSVFEAHDMLRALKIAEENPLTPLDSPHGPACRAMEQADYVMLREKVTDAIAEAKHKPTAEQRRRANAGEYRDPA